MTCYNLNIRWESHLFFSVKTGGSVPPVCVLTDRRGQINSLINGLWLRYRLNFKIRFVKGDFLGYKSKLIQLKMALSKLGQFFQVVFLNLQ